MAEADGGKVGPLRGFVRRVPPLRRALIFGLTRARRVAAVTHLQELWAYGRQAVRRPSATERPQVRFIIYGQGRSGSSVLLDLIASHPDVHCESEIFNRKVAARLLAPERYIRARADLSPGRAYGCKMKIYQMTEDQGIRDPHQFLRDLHADGWKVVHLLREDLFRKALSLVVAETRGQFLDRREGSAMLESLRIDPERLLAAMRERRRADEKERAALGDIPHVTVVYERDLLDPSRHQETSDRVLEFLGLPSAPVETRFVKTSRSQVSDYVTNYSELCAVLRDSEFAACLPVAETG